MKTHYSCAELAALKLPGFPSSKKGWYGVVDREKWGFRDVPGKGGKNGLKREFLPPPAVLKLIRKQDVIEVLGARDEVQLTLRVSIRQAAHIIRWLEREARRV